MSIFDQHEKIALQFSGGRDSLALLLFMKPYWDKLTVYYCNPGDAYPETLALMDAVKAVVPNFVEIKGYVQETRAQHGWSSDVLPAGASWHFGKDQIPNHLPLIDRYSCCYLSMMKPTHDRMKEDGVTCVLRGQRLEDNIKSHVQSGQVIDGIQVVFPLNDWTTAQVDQFIADAGVSLPPYYAEGLTSAPDCMHCTAWLEHKANKYLNKHHPEVATEVNRRLRLIKVAVQSQTQHLDAALEEHKC